MALLFRPSCSDHNFYYTYRTKSDRDHNDDDDGDDNER